jgi:hypothetical protein
MIIRLFLSVQPSEDERIEIEEDTILYVKCIGVQANCFRTEWILEGTSFDFGTCNFDKLKLKRNELDESPVKLVATSDYLDATVEFEVSSMSIISDFPSPIEKNT